MYRGMLAGMSLGNWDIADKKVAVLAESTLIIPTFFNQ